MPPTWPQTPPRSPQDFRSAPGYGPASTTLPMTGPSHSSKRSPIAVKSVAAEHIWAFPHLFLFGISLCVCRQTARCAGRSPSKRIGVARMGHSPRLPAALPLLPVARHCCELSSFQMVGTHLALVQGCRIRPSHNCSAVSFGLKNESAGAVGLGALLSVYVVLQGF